MLARQLNRSRTWLIRNARIFSGNGKVIENGAVLVKNGKIAEVYDGDIPDPKDLNASATEAAGKTILPGLIDTHVHLAAPGGVIDDWKDYDVLKASQRELAAYLYSGVTAVRSLGDPLDSILKVRATVNSGERLGAELFVAGPLFTTAGGYGTQYFQGMPQNLRLQAEAQLLRMPTTPAEARRDVDALKASGVDAIKSVSLPPALLDSIGAAARANKLPFAVHTGDVSDIEAALHAGAGSIEHGSFRQPVPDSIFGMLAMNRVAYDPTLYAVAPARLDILNRSLVQQVVSAKMLAATRRQPPATHPDDPANSQRQSPQSLEIRGDPGYRHRRWHPAGLPWPNNPI